MPCMVRRQLLDEYFNAWRERDHHEIMRLTRANIEHMDDCPICNGKIPQPDVPLADQLFRQHVKVTGEK